MFLYLGVLIINYDHMGVTLYYHGTLRTPQDVHALISEIVDIATANHWKYNVFDDPWDRPVDLRLEHDDNNMPRFTGNAGLKGIMLAVHPEAEGVDLLFDKDGILRSLINMIDPPGERDSFVFTKTQFAGVDLHIQLVNLLEYVGKQYMQEWNLEDDCGYVVHRDREKALAVFHSIGDAINALSEAFETIEIPDDLKKENEEEFIAKVEERLRQFLPGADIRSIRNEEE